MSALLLDGKSLAASRRQELKSKITAKINQGFSAPTLAVILVGDDAASEIYVNNKKKACEEVGIKSKSFHLPYSTTESELSQLILELNHSPSIHGILVQLPLPSHINTTVIIELLNPEKDVDGFHPFNLGRLAQRLPLLRPCTPMGIINLLSHYQIPIKKRHAVVVGASNIVGRPMLLEFLLAGATTTICHKFTQNLQKHVQTADILVIATGKPDLIDTRWLHKGQVIVDVGIHRLPDKSIRGDLNFSEAVQKVAWITPVPGGVGPMTIVSLLENTFKAYLNLIAV